MRSDAPDVPSYLDALEDPWKDAVAGICGLIEKHSPDCEPSMNHGMPFYRLGDEPYLAVARQKHHVSFYVLELEDTLEENPDLAEAFSSYGRGKNCLRFRSGQLEDLPWGELARLVRLTHARRAGS